MTLSGREASKLQLSTMQRLITGLMALTLATVTAAQGPTAAAPAVSTFSGCPLAELTPILNSLMEQAGIAGNQVIEGVAPEVLAAASAIPEAEYESIAYPLVDFANNVSVAFMEPELLAEVEATYPDCEVEDVVVLAEVLTFAGLGVDLLVPLHEVALVAEGAAEAPTAAAAAG